MISIDAHWKEWLGSIRIEEIHNCNLFLMVKAKAGAPSVLDEENTRLENSVWQSYCGLLLADRFGVGQDLDGIGQKLPRTKAQNFSKRILKCTWLGEFNNIIL